MVAVVVLVVLLVAVLVIVVLLVVGSLAVVRIGIIKCSISRSISGGCRCLATIRKLLVNEKTPELKTKFKPV